METIYQEPNLIQTGKYNTITNKFTPIGTVIFAYKFLINNQTFNISEGCNKLAKDLINNKDKNTAILNKNHCEKDIRKLCELILKDQLGDYKI